MMAQRSCTVLTPLHPRPETSSDRRRSVLQHLISSRPAHSLLAQLSLIARGLALPPPVAQQLVVERVVGHWLLRASRYLAQHLKLCSSRSADGPSEPHPSVTLDIASLSDSCTSTTPLYERRRYGRNRAVFCVLKSRERPELMRATNVKGFGGPRKAGPVLTGCER